jgi:hypothetical protein
VSSDDRTDVSSAGLWHLRPVYVCENGSYCQAVINLFDTNTIFEIIVFFLWLVSGSKAVASDPIVAFIFE